MYLLGERGLEREEIGGIFDPSYLYMHMGA